MKFLVALAFALSTSSTQLTFQMYVASVVRPLTVKLVAVLLADAIFEAFTMLSMVRLQFKLVSIVSAAVHVKLMFVRLVNELSAGAFNVIVGRFASTLKVAFFSFERLPNVVFTLTS